MLCELVNGTGGERNWRTDVMIIKSFIALAIKPLKNAITPHMRVGISASAWLLKVAASQQSLTACVSRVETIYFRNKFTLGIYQILWHL